MPSMSRRKKAIHHWFNLGHRRCRYCHCQLVYNPDQKNTASCEHLVPKSQGGTEALVNLIVVCTSCNTKRQNMDFIDFVKGLPLEDWLLKKYSEAVGFYFKSGKKISINKKKIKNLLTST